uniref:nucleolar protein 6-like n=1 Tax=Styela clava TaxID=7725 RepID=UPI001939CC63|nr:nucleolar protein 6-like [Styela clava]
MESPEFVDEDEESDLEEDVPPAKSSKLSGSDLYKPPTTEELNTLRDTNMLFHSNLTKLQITELLKEVTLSKTKREKVDEYLHSLHDVIMTLPITDKFKLSESQKMFDQIQIPFVMKPAKVKGEMKCTPPADIQVVGSYLLDTNLKQKLNIDLVLELPTESMQAKDHLNQRYLRKRAVYLAYIAHYLLENDLISELKFAYSEENPLKPVLLLKPSGKLSNSLIVRVHTCPGKESFKLERFLPHKSNVRKSWFTGISTKQDDVSLNPTPHYNSIVLRDMLMVEHLKYLFESFSEYEGIRDGIKLLKVWLRQRELDQGTGCFNGFIISMLAAYLLEKRRINKMMSSYQVVRNVFQYLSTSDWTEEGISFKDQDTSEFHKYFEIVFVDPTGTLNLCSEMSAAVYYQVCQEAEYSLKTLDNKVISNGFDAVFMTSLPFIKKFDHIIHVCRPWLLHNSCERMNLIENLPDYGGNAINCAVPKIMSVLRQGLRSRVKLIGVKGCKYGMWSTDSHPPSWKDPLSTLSFGFILTSDASSIIDKGPTAETPEASSFREFWGDKSELRRFQDGSICEAVVWNCKNKTDKRNILENITKHILRLHCNLSSNSIIYNSNQIEEILTLKTDSKQTEYVPVPGYVGTGDEVNIKLVHSYNELCRQLRNLKDLPLTVVSLQGVSPALRYTEVYPPTQVIIPDNQVMKKIMKKIQIPDSEDSAPPYVHAIEVICHLEGSGKWPQDVEALRRLKAAFHITFSDELEKEHSELTCVPTQTYLDVFKDGFVFRIIIAYHREITIMQTFTTNDGLVKNKITPESIALEEKTSHLPKLASVLHGLTQKFPSFCLTTRLAKRWINGQLLSRHVPEIVIELLCASLYTNPEPYTTPGSAQVGFIRFLSFISKFDFNSNLVIVDFNNELEEFDITTIQEHFNTNRDSLPTMFIATNKDKTRSIWTRKQPTCMILRRLQALAVISLKNLENEIMSLEKGVSTMSIFHGSLSAYDVVIHLEPKCVARKYEACQVDGDIVEEDLATQNENSNILPVVGFDPVQSYLDELESSYGELAMFFHNTNGGQEIGVLWRPNAFQPREFKLTTALCSSILSKSKVAANVKTVIEDFQIIGKGLVSNIELRTDKWKI